MEREATEWTGIRFNIIVNLLQYKNVILIVHK